MRGGGGKKDFARVSLFSALEFVWRVDLSGLVMDRVGILVRPPSVGGSVTYLLAVQRSRSETLSSHSSQCSFFEDSISLAYSFVTLQCWSWASWSGSSRQRWEAFANLFFFLRKAVSAGVHHLLVNGKGVDMGTIASIEDLIEALSEARAVWSSVGEVRRLGGGELLRSEARWSTKSGQFVARKLRDGRGTFRIRGMFRVVRMGRWSVLGP